MYREDIMLPAQDNEFTSLMRKKLENYDFEKEEFPGKDDMENESLVPPVVFLNTFSGASLKE